VTEVIGADGELAHRRSEFADGLERFCFTLLTRDKAQPFELSDIRGRESPNVVDMQLLVRQLPDVVEIDQRLERHRSVDARRLSLR